MQAVDSESGEVADETTLRKPHSWRANPDGRLRTIALFHANYTPVRITAFRAMRSIACFALHARLESADCEHVSIDVVGIATI